MSIRTCLVASVLLLAACNGSTAPVDQDYESLPADQVGVGIEHFISTEGIRRAHLRADTAYLFEDSARTHLKTVHLQMFDEEGRPSSTLTSETGEYNTDTQRTVARGNVVLIIPGPEGGTLYTEELHYDPVTKRVWSDVHTRMVTNDGKNLEGERFTSDDQFQNIDIPGGSGTGIPLPVGRRDP